MPNTAPVKPLPPARAAALEAVHRCLNTEVSIQAALDRAISTRCPDPRDAALATELAYGYLRLKGRLEFVLGRFLKAPDKMPPKMLLTMGMAAYELLHLDKIPAYATLSWAVDFAKTKPGTNLAGLFNAVLRKVTGLTAETMEEDIRRQGGSQAHFLSRFYACPMWMVKLWLDAYPEETVLHYLKAQVEPPALGLNLYGHPQAEDVFNELAGLPDIMDIDGLGFAFPAGTSLPPIYPPVARQSFAARQALEALNPQTWPTPVWDACAGRGGKTRLLLEHGIPVVASDVHEARLAGLHSELPQVPVFLARADADAPVKDPGTILLDLPCSGLGVLSRRPDTKWKRTPADLIDLVALQNSILDHAAATVRPGGVLAVITCTLNPDENQNLIDTFLARTPKAKLETVWTTDPDSPLGEFFWAAKITC